jgi:hypothetical protein
MPGLYTPYKEVSILSPNTLIDINERKIKRFFPREKLKKQKINDELIKNIADILKNTFNVLAKKYKLAVSLTGGIDTRLTLASSKTYKDKITYFTYVFDNDAGHYDDLKIAREISKITKIKHEEYIINSTEHEEYLDLFNRNCSFLRSEKQGKLAYAIYKKYPKNHLHIKSTVSEIGEGFYFRHFPPIPAVKIFLPQILTYFYRTNKKSHFTKNAFKDFIRITNFNEILKYNYNYYDMFYWEHRNGCWQSLQNQDFNISHDIFIIYNNRYILNKLLSVPIKNRIECTLQFKIIDYMWPELSNIKFNSWRPSTLRQKITKKIWNLFSFFLP